MADTKSLIIGDIKEVIIRNLYREEKNYKQPIQMYCYSRYSDAFPFRVFNNFNNWQSFAITLAGFVGGKEFGPQLFFYFS